VDGPDDQQGDRRSDAELRRDGLVQRRSSGSFAETLQPSADLGPFSLLIALVLSLLGVPFPPLLSLFGPPISRLRDMQYDKEQAFKLWKKGSDSDNAKSKEWFGTDTSASGATMGNAEGTD